MKALTAQELRIGNFIKDIDHPERECTIFRLNSGNDWPITYSYGRAFEFSPPKQRLEGIPLTEEWLKRMGFEGGTEGFFKNEKIEIGYITTDEALQFEYISSFGINLSKVIDIKFVHQLQNLYFVLTGEELLIKD